jgi:hypothetical protein
MSLRRIRSGLAALALVVLAGLPALAQDYEVRGMQPFEPSDVRPYGNWAKPNEGFFLSFEGIYWSISAPEKTTVGFPGLTRQVFTGPSTLFETTERNTLDTDYRAKWKQGDRIELGFIGEHHGWLVTTLELNQQTQHLAADNVPIVFADPVFGQPPHSLLEGNVGIDPVTGATVIANVPVVFDHVSTRNITKLEGVELAYLYRPAQLHRGGNLEFLMGARYVYLRDDFSVVARSFSNNTADVRDNPNQNALADSFWDNEVKNQIVGPEIGLRWSKPIGRFSLSSEGRFMAGLNSQSVRQNGELASLLTTPPNTGLLQPLLMRATSFDHKATFYEFTPLIELRVEGHVQITRLISAKAGWTGMWMDGIARASDMVDYTVPSMGITKGIGVDGNKQNVFVQGLTLGIELNR